jgi:hypothetical protein
MNTTALCRFESATLAEFNRRLVEEHHQTKFHFSSYDELNDAHDNEDSVRKYLTGIAEHVIMEYIDALSTEEMNALENALSMQNISEDMQRRRIDIRCALWERYILNK